MLTPLKGFHIMNIQSDFPSLKSPNEVMKVEKEIESEELSEVKVEDEKNSFKFLLDIQKKIQELEKNEKSLREELKAAKSELNKKKIEEEKPQNVVVIQSKKEEKDVEGFWATVCRIGKGILGSILGLLGIKI